MNTKIATLKFTKRIGDMAKPSEQFVHLDGVVAGAVWKEQVQVRNNKGVQSLKWRWFARCGVDSKVLGKGTRIALIFGGGYADRDEAAQALLKEWEGIAGGQQAESKPEAPEAPQESPRPKSKTERFLASFQAVVIRPEHRNYGDESPCLRDCGIGASIASKLIHWAEHFVPHETLVCTLESGTSGRPANTWHWMPAFLQDAFRKHTELFGEADLPPAALRMRDTGSCWE